MPVSRSRRIRSDVPIAHALLLFSASFLPAIAVAQSLPASQDDAGATTRTLDAVSVSAPRRAPGATIGDPTPDVQLGPEDIQSYGASTVEDLLLAIEPITASGNGDDPAVVLLNGLRISGRAEIRDIPTEAIRQIDVLPEEEALLYGYPPNQKVVNIVLFPEFGATVAELNGGRPTAGGRESGGVNASRFAVELDNRINLALAYSTSTALSAISRDYVPVSTWPPYDLRGNVVATRAGQEIDPALSALAGSSVTIAGVPDGLADRAATLEDFITTAGLANVSDVRAERTLAAANHALVGNAVWSRAFGDATFATLNFNGRADQSDSLRGLAGVGLLVPQGNPYSPFTTDVVVDRYVPVTLRQNSRNWSGGLNGALNHDADRWRISITGSYNHEYSRTNTDAGVDKQFAQALLAGLSTDFNPFGLLDPALFPRRAPNVAQSSIDSASLELVMHGTILDMPAGPLIGSLKIGDSANRVSSRSRRTDTVKEARLSRNDAGAQVNFDLPLTSRTREFAPGAGDLAIKAHAAVNVVSDFDALMRWGYGARWSPIAAVTFSANVEHEQSAPSPQQLGNPEVTITDARVFDFSTGETASVIAIRGGNADLEASRRRRFRAGLTVKPFRDRQLSFIANYVDSNTSDSVGALPPPTAAMKALLPERFAADEEGNLTMVDYRPLNFAAEIRRQLRWGFSDSRPVGDWFGTGPVNQPRAGNGRLVISLYDTIVFENRVLVRAGMPMLDLLHGDAIGTRGGRARHQVEGSIGYNEGTLGVRLAFTWRSGTTIHGGESPAGNLDFSSLATLNARLFAEFDRMSIAKQHPWLGGTRITLSVDNLLDRRVHVADANGMTPPSYQSAILDPVGRAIALSLRKRFL